ncbi:hypothetical protein EDB81DRAFT_808481 [Dactylonectria macrodidyma]|uniref:DUF924-domain-containing protein n=1 Tax=Dactylonectria macrodidyma TaxID=307937 RepID=A0A9P9INC7_9HYPO|nr:hypothetical protein EDB81DRAFT_808481 [Dactylonectria macrodidyma]
MDSQGQKNGGLIKQHLTLALLKDLREFWYEHLENEEDFIMPTADHNRRWYMSGKELDNICLDRFAPVLEAIRESGATTGAEVLRTIQPREPLDWLSLVILLDQIPRNCYRGERSKIVFRFFDPIAQQVSLEAIAQGLPDQSPQIRWNFAYRSWFYMPLMHSESLSSHDKAVEGYTLLEKDVSSLTEGPCSPGADDFERRAREVIQRNVKAAKAMAETNVAFEKKHRDIIQQFGRYPHRNKAMGREPTTAETEYLDNGGETFGG